MKIALIEITKALLSVISMVLPNCSVMMNKRLKMTKELPQSCAKNIETSIINNILWISLEST